MKLNSSQFNCITYIFIIYFQLAAFRSIQSADGANLTHNFRPVQPLNDRVIYQNNINEITEAPATMTTSTPRMKTTMHHSDVPLNTNSSQHSGQERTWPASCSYFFCFALHILSSWHCIYVCIGLKI